jgi:hypothetical protein
MKTLTEKFYRKEELTKKQRKEIRAGDIRLNQAQCKKCKDIITSDNRHDFKMCKCGAIGVDGGSWYIKRIAKDLADIKELSKYYKDI